MEARGGRPPQNTIALSPMGLSPIVQSAPIPYKIMPQISIHCSLVQIHTKIILLNTIPQITMVHSLIHCRPIPPIPIGCSQIPQSHIPHQTMVPIPHWTSYPTGPLRSRPLPLAPHQTTAGMAVRPYRPTHPSVFPPHQTLPTVKRQK